MMLHLGKTDATGLALIYFLRCHAALGALVRFHRFRFFSAVLYLKSKGHPVARLSPNSPFSISQKTRNKAILSPNLNKSLYLPA